MEQPSKPIMAPMQPKRSQELTFIRSAGRISAVLIALLAISPLLSSANLILQGRFLREISATQNVLLAVLMVGISLCSWLASRRLDFGSGLLSSILSMTWIAPMLDYPMEGIGCVTPFFAFPALAGMTMLTAAIINHPPNWLLSILRPGYRSAIPQEDFPLSPLDSGYRVPLLLSLAVVWVLARFSFRLIQHGLDSLPFTGLSAHFAYTYATAPLIVGCISVIGGVSSFTLLMGRDALVEKPVFAPQKTIPSIRIQRVISIFLVYLTVIFLWGLSTFRINPFGFFALGILILVTLINRHTSNSLPRLAMVLMAGLNLTLVLQDQLHEKIFTRSLDALLLSPIVMWPLLLKGLVPFLAVLSLSQEPLLHQSKIAAGWVWRNRTGLVGGVYWGLSIGLSSIALARSCQAVDQPFFSTLLGLLAGCFAALIAFGRLRESMDLNAP